jgi:hypothetical protein
MFAVILTTLVLWQDPAPPPKPAEPAPAPAPATPAKPVEAWDDQTAKQALDEFTQAMKGTPNMAQKNRALDLFAGGANKQLVKPLAQLVETEKLVVIRKRAAELLANQPAADANGVIRRLLKSARVAAQPPVMAELVRGLGRCGYDKAQWSELGDLFEREYHVERVPLQEAVLDLVIMQKEKQALPLLLRNLDEPTPENVDARENPPQEYWEARWKSWAAWKTKVKDALFAVTGQRFSTSAEAKAWLQKNPVK